MELCSKYQHACKHVIFVTLPANDRVDLVPLSQYTDMLNTSPSDIDGFQTLMSVQQITARRMKCVWISLEDLSARAVKASLATTAAVSVAALGSKDVHSLPDFLGFVFCFAIPVIFL